MSSPGRSRVAVWVLVAGTAASLAPFLSLLAASGAAGLLGCRLDEGSAHSCLVGGTDIGGPLYTGFVLGWLALLTWPGLLVCLAAWLWLAIRHWRKRASA